MMYSHLSRGTTVYNDDHKYSCLSDISLLQQRKSALQPLFVTRSKSAAARRDDSLSNRIQLSSSTKYSKGATKKSARDTISSSSGNNNKKNTNEQNSADWRAWFSSTEYDDPWSPYRPLSSSQLQQHSSNTNNSQTVVNTILTDCNDWERRRHGMNLVPLSLLHLNDDVSRLDSADIHPQNDTIHNNNNNNNSELSKLQKRTQWIDTQTRFTIQMLHDLHDSGIRRQMDRPTVERCHRMIGRLLSLTPRDGNVFTVVKDDAAGGGRVGSTIGNGGGGSSQEVTVQITGTAQRGNAILERMEMCSPVFLPQMRIWQRQQQQRQFRQRGGDVFDFSSLEQPAIESISSSSSVLDHHAAKVPKHLLQTKQAIPTPTRAIYNMVLLLYAKEAGPRYVAEQAEDVVWGMIVRGLQLEEFHKLHDGIEGAKIQDEEMSTPLFPSTQNWNCVLQSWSNSADPNRAFFAYSFFKSWVEWNESRSGEVDGSIYDLQSFHWMLKACVVDEFTVLDDEGDSNNSATSEKLLIQRAKEVGSRVAIGIWRDMRTRRNENSQIRLTSDTYEHLLLAMCQTTDRSRGLLAAVAAVFQSCRNDGMETKQITELVRGVMTESQFQKLLRNERT